MSAAEKGRACPLRQVHQRRRGIHLVVIRCSAELSPEVAMEARVIASRKFYHLRGNLLMDAQKISALRRLEPPQAVAALRALCERLDDRGNRRSRTFRPGATSGLAHAPRPRGRPSCRARRCAVATDGADALEWSGSSAGDSLGVPSPDRSRSVSPDPRTMPQSSSQRSLEPCWAAPSPASPGRSPAGPHGPARRRPARDDPSARARAAQDACRGAASAAARSGRRCGELQQMAAAIERTLRFVRRRPRRLHDEVLQLVACAPPPPPAPPPAPPGPGPREPRTQRCRRDNGRVMLESIARRSRAASSPAPLPLQLRGPSTSSEAQRSMERAAAAAAAAAAASTSASPHDGTSPSRRPRGVADHCDLLARARRTPRGRPGARPSARPARPRGDSGGSLARRSSSASPPSSSTPPPSHRRPGSRRPALTVEAPRKAPGRAAGAPRGGGAAAAGALTDPAALRCIQCAGQGRRGARRAAANWVSDVAAGRPGGAPGLEYLRALRDRAAQSRRVEAGARRRLLRLELELLARLPAGAPAPRPFRLGSELPGRLSGLNRDEAAAALERALDAAGAPGVCGSGGIANLFSNGGVGGSGQRRARRRRAARRRPRLGLAGAHAARARTPPHRGSPLAGPGGADSSEEPVPFAPTRAAPRGAARGGAPAGAAGRAAAGRWRRSWTRGRGGAVAQFRREMAQLARTSSCRRRTDSCGGSGPGTRRGSLSALPPIEINDEDASTCTWGSRSRSSTRSSSSSSTATSPSPPPRRRRRRRCLGRRRLRLRLELARGPGRGRLRAYTALSAPPSPLWHGLEEGGAGLDSNPLSSSAAAAAAAAYSLAWARGRSPFEAGPGAHDPTFPPAPRAASGAAASRPARLVPLALGRRGAAPGARRRPRCSSGRAAGLAVGHLPSSTRSPSPGPATAAAAARATRGPPPLPRSPRASRPLPHHHPSPHVSAPGAPRPPASGATPFH
eukprot:tig00000263_g23271.t1